MITKEEYYLLKLFSKKWQKRYIIRNKNKSINFFENKPIKDMYYGDWEASGMQNIVLGYYATEWFSQVFKSITWEDKEPKRIIDYIREYEQWEEKNEENKKD